MVYRRWSGTTLGKTRAVVTGTLLSNRRRTQMKVLAYEEGGYCVWSKRLEQGQFALMGIIDSDKRALSCIEFLALLKGIDMVIKRQRKRYKGRHNRAGSGILSSVKSKR